MCPCESGKPYLKCCFPCHLDDSRKNRAIEEIEKLKKKMSGMNFASLEEANAFLRRQYEKINSAPQEDFLGLSRDQVYQIMNFSFPPLSDLVVFRTDFLPESLAGIPVVRDSIFFLGQMAEAGPLKATASGYLPPEFARRLFDKIDRSPVKPIIKFRSEADSQTVEVLRLLLTWGKWIKKEKGRFRLTWKGQRVVEDGFSGEEYFDLMSTYIRNFNWASIDGFAEYDIIQRATVFSLYLLKKKAASYTKSYSLSPYFIRAFPLVLRDAPRREWMDEFSDIDRCWTLRFLERFCLSFGLIEIQGDSPGPLDLTITLKTTPVFDRLFGWRTGYPGVH